MPNFVRFCGNCRHAADENGHSVRCRLDPKAPKTVQFHALCPSWTRGTSLPEPKPKPEPEPPPRRELTPDDEERVIRALRHNRYHRHLRSVALSAMLPQSLVQLALDALMAAGRVARVDEMYRLTDETQQLDTPAARERIAESLKRVVAGKSYVTRTRLLERFPRPDRALAGLVLEELEQAGELARHGDLVGLGDQSRRERLKRRQAKESGRKERQGSIQRQHERAERAALLCAAVGEVVSEHAKDTALKSRADADDMQAAVRKLHRLAFELELPLSELLAAAEVRAGFRPRTDVFELMIKAPKAQEGS